VIEIPNQFLSDIRPVRGYYDMSVARYPDRRGFYREFYTNRVEGIIGSYFDFPFAGLTDYVLFSPDAISSYTASDGSVTYYFDLKKFKTFAQTSGQIYLDAENIFIAKYKLLLDDADVMEVRPFLRRYLIEGLNANDWRWTLAPWVPFSRELSFVNGRLATPSYLVDANSAKGAVKQEANEDAKLHIATWPRIDANSPQVMKDTWNYLNGEVYPQEYLFLTTLRSMLMQGKYAPALAAADDLIARVTAGIVVNQGKVQKYQIVATILSEGLRNNEIIEKVYLVDVFGQEIALELIKLRRDAEARVSEAQTDADNRLYQATIDANQIRREADTLALGMQIDLDYELDSMLRDYQLMSIALSDQL